MLELRNLLVEELQELLHAEQHLAPALQRMADVAENSLLKENLESLAQQSQLHEVRLENVFSVLGEKIQARPCKAMMGFIEESEDRMQTAKGKRSLERDLAITTITQKIEQYQIASYLTTRFLARQMGEFEATHLLSHSLQEEEDSSSFLAMCAKPLLQQAAGETSHGPRERRENGVY